MKNLHFEYCMEIHYDVDVTRCHYTIKCIPVDNDRQKITDVQIEMLPESKPEWGNDGLGNRYIYGCNESPHNYFKYHISGNAECGISEYDSGASENEMMIFRHGHGLTMPGEKIKSYYEAIEEQLGDLSPRQKAIKLMDALYNDFSYEKGYTNVTTTAEEAFGIGKGVCQDYAHILVSLLNLAGCSARYVTGLIIGEGESHAWVEVADDGKWYGIDPTNHVLVGDSHIRLGAGRDATECQLNRGIMHGGGNQTQNIQVSVSEVGLGQKYLQKGTLL